MDDNTGGPAFPGKNSRTYTNLTRNSPSDPNEITYADSGMTLRDYMAGQALIMLPHMGCGADLDTQDTAKAAYQIADAMISARGDK